MTLLCVDVLKVIKRYRHYFPRPLAILAINRILMYVDDPVTMESVLTAPECLNKSFLHNSFFARHGILHAEGISISSEYIIHNTLTTLISFGEILLEHIKMIVLSRLSWQLNENIKIYSFRFYLVLCPHLDVKVKLGASVVNN